VICPIFVNMKIDEEQIAKNILLARTIKGLTQEGLAKAVGLSQQWKQKVEKAEVNLTIEHINSISNALDVTPQFLMFSIPSQVFNNCFNNSSLSGTGSFNNCVINAPDVIEKVNEIKTLFERYLNKSGK
jgi:transcriptional regulator with XRE-family HTH domain